jgi:hypothetical protein
VGWNLNDKRNSIGTALLDGDYRTTWEYYSVPIRKVLTASLAFVKGGSSQLPRPLDTRILHDDVLLKHLILDLINNAQNQELDSIFHRKYDMLIPLPSSNFT